MSRAALIVILLLRFGLFWAGHTAPLPGSAFAYEGAYAEALMRRKDWFQSLGLPTYVAWWVAEDHNVDWVEGSERLDHLHAHGPSAFAFNFAKPFDAGGNPSPYGQNIQTHTKQRDARDLPEDGVNPRLRDIYSHVVML